MTTMDQAERRARAHLLALPSIRAAVWDHIESHGAASALEQIQSGYLASSLTSDEHARLDKCDVDDQLSRAEEIGASLVCPGDPNWPDLSDLETWPVPGIEEEWRSWQPLALWVRGDQHLLTDANVYVTGSSTPTQYGQYVAGDLADQIADTHLVATSGALGCETAATRGALTGHTERAIVALPCGVDVAHPRDNAHLLETVLLCGGTLISPHTLGAQATRSRAQETRRLLVALTDATLLVECAGPLSRPWESAQMAMAIGRKVLAVPGPITSRASDQTNQAIRDGDAEAVLDLHDIRRHL